MSCNPRTGRIHRALFPAFGISLVLVMAALFRTDVSPKAFTWQERNVLLGHTGTVLTMAVSPDSRRLASGDLEGKDNCLGPAEWDSVGQVSTSQGAAFVGGLFAGGPHFGD